MIQSCRNRSKYYLAAAILTLLTLPVIAHAEGSIAQDLSNWKQGVFAHYTTKGHAKANGINLQMKIPSGWKQSEGERPHIVQKFSLKYDNDRSVVLVIQVTPIPAEMRSLPDSTIADALFDPNQQKNMLPDGASLSYTKRTKYENQPGIIILYSLVAERAGVTVNMTIMTHRLLYHRHMVDVSVSFTVPSTSDKELSALEAQSFRELGLLIGNSVVLPDEY